MKRRLSRVDPWTLTTLVWVNAASNGDQSPCPVTAASWGSLYCYSEVKQDEKKKDIEKTYSGIDSCDELNFGQL